MLSAVNALESVTTSHLTNGTPAFDSYNANVPLDNGTKVPVAVTVVSAPYITVPFDVALSNFGGFYAGFNLMAVRPAVGDAFKLKVTYSNGTSEFLTSSVTGVLDSFAQNPTTSGANPNIPTFNWAAPAVPPGPYTYRLNVRQQNGSQAWDYPRDSGIPSTQTSVAYNFDGRANPVLLVTGTVYDWTITVRDSNRNEAQRQSSYKPL